MASAATLVGMVVRATTGADVEVAMRAAIGDRVVIESAQVGQTAREGEVLEVRGQDGTPPWVVRWSGEEQGNLFYPGPDARVTNDDTT